MNVPSMIEIRDAVKKYDRESLSNDDKILLMKTLYIDKNYTVNEKEALFIASVWYLDYEVQLLLNSGYSPREALFEWDILPEKTPCKTLNNKFCLEDIYYVQIHYKENKNQYCLYLYLNEFSLPQCIPFKTLEEALQVKDDLLKEYEQFYEKEYNMVSSRS